VITPGQDGDGGAGDAGEGVGDVRPAPVKPILRVAIGVVVMAVRLALAGKQFAERAGGTKAGQIGSAQMTIKYQGPFLTERLAE
jgi:hypothetical protein